MLKIYLSVPSLIKEFSLFYYTNNIKRSESIFFDSLLNC